MSLLPSIFLKHNFFWLKVRDSRGFISNKVFASISLAGTIFNHTKKIVGFAFLRIFNYFLALSFLVEAKG